ncbi:MAG: type I restriction enzyme HsdR N-terminal domain-containing protein [Elusimicrobia bacterium]|nr:type I restriction enzyme HsdR N-terminal domain-containing protein [Elusimicrobiota bacterium]
MTDIRKPLKKLLPYLIQAQSDNLNEADTVQRLIKVFEEVLGYDVMTDISREAQLKNKYVDIALKIDGVVKLLVEVKAASEILRDRHIEQAQAYASRNNFRWVVLTNGLVWTLYHLTFEEGIEYEKVFSCDLSKGETFDVSAEHLSLLHKDSIKDGKLDDFWQKNIALSPATIGRAVFQETALAHIRREIRRETGLLIDYEDLGSAIHKMLSPEALALIGPLKIKRRRLVRRQKTIENVSSDGQPQGIA